MKRFFLGAVAVCSFVLGLALIAYANPSLVIPHVEHEFLEVNSSIDVVADDGFCTLREAVEIAVGKNMRSGGKDGECKQGFSEGAAIYLNASDSTYFVDVDESGGPIKVTRSAVLVNKKEGTAAIDSRSATHAFDLFNASTLELENVILKGGI